MNTTTGEDFTCVECDRDIWRTIARPTEPKLCAECLHMPGWFTDLDLCQLLDPELAAKLREEKYKAQRRDNIRLAVTVLAAAATCALPFVINHFVF